MSNHYEEEAAREVEAQIKELRARAVRFAAHPTLHTRVAGVEEQIAILEAKPLANWRATGRWAEELWAAAASTMRCCTTKTTSVSRVP